MAGGISFALGLIVVVFVQHATAQTVHIVGDSTGWTIPPSPTFYPEWAAKNHVALGDSLQFTFGTGAHDVAKVSKESFEECNPEEPIGNVMSTGPATVKIDAAGEHYFICTVGKHCSGGQKLSVTVSATAGGAATPSSSNTTTTTPAPTTATSPSHNDSSAALAPETAPSSSPTSNSDEASDAPSASSPTSNSDESTDAPSSSPTNNSGESSDAPSSSPTNNSDESSSDAPSSSATKNNNSDESSDGGESSDAPAPTASSAATVMATLYVTLFAIVMIFMF